MHRRLPLRLPTAGSPASQAPSPRTARGCLTTFFALDGFLFASWAVRVPAVKAQVGASPAELGLALLGLSAGSIATMTLSGALCRRAGSRNVVVASSAMLSAVLVLPAFAPTALVLGLALAVFGMAYGALNVSMNSVAVDIVAAVRRPIMPSFHAAWSFGGLAGAGVGGLIAPHLSPRPGLAVMAAGGLLITAVAGPPLLPAAAGRVLAAAGGSGPAAGAGSARPPGRAWLVIVTFGLIALCSSFGEGSIADWGALHLRQDLGTSAGLAATGYASFAVAEACGRLAGTRLLSWLGQARVLAGGGIAAFAGMLATALAPDLVVALAGFALTGLGVANMFPAAMSQAGQAAGERGVAAASTFGYAGFLIGPPTIGLLASAIGLRDGLAIMSVLALAAAVLALASRRLPDIKHPEDSESGSNESGTLRPNCNRASSPAQGRHGTLCVVPCIALRPRALTAYPRCPLYPGSPPHDRPRRQQQPEERAGGGR
jgi:MFS family permease